MDQRPIVTRLDQLAEHLANGLTVPQAAREMNMYSGDANSLLQRIRGRLGAQAK
jgi:hypothetical protein